MGDLTPLGWTTTTLYLFAFFVSARSASSSAGLSHGSAPFERRGWRLVAVATFVLGLNKQLDLQLWVTILGKALLRAIHFYEYRRLVQVSAFLVVLVAVIAGGLATAPIFLRASRFLRVAFGGLTLIVFYVILRAALFQKISGVGGREAVALMEPFGALTIVFASVSYARSHR